MGNVRVIKTNSAKKGNQRRIIERNRILSLIDQNISKRETYKGKLVGEEKIEKEG